MNRSRVRALALAAALVIAFSLVSPAPAQEPSAYRQGDRSLTAYNILPPGQGRYMNSAELVRAQTEGTQPERNTNQIAMYDAMVQEAPDVTAEQLDELFKDASFGVKPENVAEEYAPREGVTVIRDDPYGVPHVYGETREDTMFGAGYVSAEDRLFMMDVLRHLGRGRLSEFLGASEANLAQDRAQRLGADYSEEELVAVAERVLSVDPVLGQQFQDDAMAFADGVNAYIEEARVDPAKLPGEYPALQVFPEEWKLTDSVAIASLIGASLGVGGGQELENAAFLHALREEGYSETEARRIYDDLRFLDDPEAPTTIEASFPWLSDLPAADPDTIAMPDDPQAVLEQARAAQPPAHVDGPFGPIPLRLPDGASNALLVGANLSTSGRPVAVFGPQVGYWSPEILMEIDLHGPGVHGRGAAFPGISLYVLLGRGEDYAWSATSAGADQVDIFAVELCEPGGGQATEESNGYVRDGECVPLLDTGIEYVAKPTAGGFSGPDQPILVEIPTWRTEEGGIAQARGTVGGAPVAFVRQRASYGAEVDSGLAYVEIMDPDRINGAKDFQRAFARFSFTFNWFYLDDRDIAYQLGGSHPIRPEGVDPSLPIWSRPGNHWEGMLSTEDTPRAISPSKGFITSWNNKQAPGFSAADNEWSYGPVHRSEPLDDRILASKTGDGRVSLVELVNAMGDAATVDLRGDKVLPYMLEVLGDQGDPQLADALEKLQAWHESGAHRRDRDGDGTYEHHDAIVIMDAWWDHALDRVFGPVLKGALDDVPQDRDDEPGPVGSAYIGGWYGQLEKELRTVLGRSVSGGFSTSYCGFGVLAACREALRVSLLDALEDLGAEEQPPPPEERDQIRYAAVGVQGQAPMRWQNRPTFQQVLEFGDLCPGHTSRRGIHLVGSKGPDVINGTPYRDVICGRSGADDLRGGDGTDILIGGSGNDILRGGGSRDYLWGGSGFDRCYGGPGGESFKSCEVRGT